MKNHNQEYFYVKEERGDIYPSVQYTLNGGNSSEVNLSRSLDTSKKRILCFSDPIPREPQIADFHKLTQYAPVISEDLKNVLESFDLKEVQFLPALIQDNRGDEHDGFYILHTCNEIKCMDWEKSQWEENFFNAEKAKTDKLVLDNVLIDQIPLKDRLVFRVWEDSKHLLFHESVVEKMLEIAPKGFTIYRLSKYDSSLPFIEEYMRNRGL